MIYAYMKLDTCQANSVTLGTSFIILHELTTIEDSIFNKSCIFAQCCIFILNRYIDWCCKSCIITLHISTVISLNHTSVKRKKLNTLDVYIHTYYIHMHVCCKVESVPNILINVIIRSSSPTISANLEIIHYIRVRPIMHVYRRRNDLMFTLVIVCEVPSSIYLLAKIKS